MHKWFSLAAMMRLLLLVGTVESTQPLRSLQGAYIRRTATSGGNLPTRMLPITLARISPLARYLLTL